VERVKINGLDLKRSAAGLDSPVVVFTKDEGSEGDDRDVARGRVGADGVGHLVAANAGQTHIEYHRIGRVETYLVDRRLAAGGGTHLIPFHLKQPDEDVAVYPVIFHNEYT